MTPAAQPVIVSYRGHIRESVLLAAQSLGWERLRGPRNTTGPGHSSQTQFSESRHGAVLHEALGSGIEQRLLVF